MESISGSNNILLRRSSRAMENRRRLGKMSYDLVKKMKEMDDPMKSILEKYHPVEAAKWIRHQMKQIEEGNSLSDSCYLKKWLLYVVKTNEEYEDETLEERGHRLNGHMKLLGVCRTGCRRFECNCDHGYDIWFSG